LSCRLTGRLPHVPRLLWLLLVIPLLLASRLWRCLSRSQGLVFNVFIRTATHCFRHRRLSGDLVDRLGLECLPCRATDRVDAWALIHDNPFMHPTDVAGFTPHIVDDSRLVDNRGVVHDDTARTDVVVKVARVHKDE
jgi:hypothetical protein